VLLLGGVSGASLTAAVAVWRAILFGPYWEGLPVLPTFIVALSAGLRFAERAVHARLPRIRAYVETSFWGPLLEGTAIGAMVTTSIVCSGAGAEFIYFQF
jgi:hypothetical protein